jgi:two-component system, chemotaxis family, protein-glutamate methylesterase/glutaminase
MATRPSSTRHNDAAARPARIMLVDDSIVVRSITERIIDSAGGFEIVGSFANARDAIDRLADQRVDLILLDIEMPGMNGLSALPHLIEKSGGARVLILSANCPEGGPAAIEALALGAADTMLKPGRGTFAGRFGELLVARLRELADCENQQAESENTVQCAAPQPVLLPPLRSIAAIGIGASTGGIMAINAFLWSLPHHLDQPLFITQHLPGGFMSFFADQLRRTGVQRAIMVAEDGMPVRPRHVYLAPGEAHIRVTAMHDGARIMLDRSPSPVGACPSVDPMMTSLAEVYGAGACAVMLSGMGRDGLEGVRRIKQAGGLVLAQDVESSVVWGMPGVVAREGLADLVMTPDELAGALSRIVLKPGAAA